MAQLLRELDGGMGEWAGETSVKTPRVLLDLVGEGWVGHKVLGQVLMVLGVGCLMWRGASEQMQRVGGLWGTLW